MRKFEKISFEEFTKEFGNDKKLYEEYKLPRRKTKYSAGYDICSLKDYVVKPGEVLKIPTGFKYISPCDEMFMIVIRSSLGYKYNIRLVNQVGIIESDYYNNESNEGHVMVKIQNEGNENFIIKEGDAVAQGIFVKFYTVDDEEEIKSIRKGGFGSTNG